MVITLSNFKGGVGKTTLAVHLATWLIDRGFRTALLDTDPQSSSKQWLTDIADPNLAIRTATTPEECVCEAQALHKDADLVVVDTAGTLHDTSRTALLLADLVVFPITPSILDLRSVAQATAVLKYAQTINGGRPSGCLVLNRFRTRDTISRELLAAAPSLGLRVCQTVIRDLKLYRDAAQQGTVVHRMGNTAKEAADELSQLFMELLPDSFRKGLTKPTKENQYEPKENTHRRAGNDG